MYPRNAASPERIGVGAVVQISDGAVQTSGVSISVRGQAGASGAGAGTTAYDNGIVEYTPTQGETDFTSFIVVAYKTGCIPASTTIVTSASATAGYAGTDQSKIANPTATVGLSGTTIKTATDVEADTADLQTRVPAALVAGRMDSSLGAVQSGVDFSATMKASINTEADTALADVGLTTTITGRIDVATSTRASQTSVDDLPTNAELAASQAAADDATLAAIAALTIPTAAAVADAVWDEAISGHAGSGSTGEALAAAGAAGDPWITNLPGSYTGVQAGKIVGDYLNAPVGDVPTATENADALLNRDMSAVTVTNSRSPINALRAIRNKWDTTSNPGFQTVYEEDDTTEAWTAALQTNAAAEPITGADPT